MSKSLESIDPTSLGAVTGGAFSRGGGGGSSIDGLIDQLNSITGAIKDINKKTSGFGNTEMLVLCMLAMQNRSAGPVVYLGRPRCW